MKAHLLALACSALMASSAFAQNSSGDVEIVVQGRQLHDILRQFVGEVATAPHGEDQLGRWDNHICPAVIGMTRRDQAQFIVDRIARRAHDVGLRIDASGCRANLVIFVTPDADALAQTLISDFHDQLQPPAVYTTSTMGQANLATFGSTDKPVRWWHVLETRSADGFRIAEPRPSMDPMSGRTVEPGAVSVFSSTRLQRATRQDFRRAVVIVDARQTAGYRIDSVADYLAMVSLAQLDTNADTSAYPSVLNLFSSPNAAAAMTDWDRAYLDGLYHVMRNARGTRQQESEITDRMTHTITRTQQAGADVQ